MGGISGHIANSNQGGKWFIYMTDLGIAFLAIHFFIDACLVTARWTWEKFRAGEYDLCKTTKKIAKMHWLKNGPFAHTDHTSDSLNIIYKFSWAMHSCFFTIALWISLIYWSVLHKSKSGYFHIFFPFTIIIKNSQLLSRTKFSRTTSL